MASKKSKQILKENVAKFAPALKRLACSAPDEALIQRIAQEVCCAWSNGDLSFNKSIRWAICEYIRRSAGKGKE